MAERLAGYSTSTLPCDCGLEAKRLSVYSFASPKRWASELVLSAAAREAHEEALGYKHEALAAKAEAEGNGFGGT